MDIKHFFNSFVFSCLFLTGCGGGSSESKETDSSITKTNIAPVARAGADLTVSGAALVTLDASSSSDSDGSIVSYQWLQVSGNNIAMSNRNTKIVSFETPVDTKDYSLTFRLTVTDNGGAEHSDEVSVHVKHENRLPQIDSIIASPNELVDGVLTVAEGTAVSLNAIASDLDGHIASYQWTQLSGQTVAVSDLNSANISFNTPQVNELETLSFKLEVTDGQGASSEREVSIQVTPAITGKVVDDPLVNAQVQLIDIVSGDVIAQTVSDAEGGYQLVFPQSTTGFLIKSSGGLLKGQPFTGEMYSLCLNAQRKECHVTPLTTLFKHYAEAKGVDISAKAETLASLNQLLNIDIENDPFIYGHFDGSVNVEEIRNAINGGSGLNQWLDGVVGYALDPTETPPEAFFSGVTTSLRVNAGKDQTVTEQTDVTLQGNASGLEGSALNYQWVQLAGKNVVLTGENTSSARFKAPSVTSPETLLFRVSVTNGDNASSYDSVKVTVKPANGAPIVNAGKNQSVSVNENVLLEGSVTGAADSIANIQWSQNEGTSVVLDNSDKLTANFIAPSVTQTETLIFTLTVANKDGEVGTDSVNVVVTPLDVNKAPLVNAGNDQAVAEQTLVQLSGTATDDGSISKYEWKQLSGPSVNLDNPQSAATTFTAPTLTEIKKLEFQFEATDNHGQSNHDTLVVTINPVNSLPVVLAGAAQSVFASAQVQLNGQATDSDGTVDTFAWTQVAGPRVISIVGNNTLSAHFTAPGVTASEQYTFKLTAWDNEGGSSSNTVNIVINPQTNAAPIAEAGVNQNVEEDSYVILNGAGTDSDGTVVAYLWEQIAGSQSINIINKEQASASFTAPSLSSVETYRFRLTVLDDDGSKGIDEVEVTISPRQNGLPAVDAGADFSEIAGYSVNLSGTASDADGSITKYLWKQVSGAVEVSLTSTDSASTSFITPKVTQDTPLTFSFTAWDNDGGMSEDTITVTILHTTQIRPVANAGGEQTVKEGDTVVLNGSASSDQDGTIVRYLWEDLTGQVTINNATSAMASFTAPQVDKAENFVIQLTVWDNDGNTHNDIIFVGVEDKGNSVPVANGGGDQTVFAGATVYLNGSATDDGKIVKYFWAQVSGGSSISIDNSNTATASFMAPNVGSISVYSFRFVAIDDNDELGYDIVKITVIPVP